MHGEQKYASFLEAESWIEDEWPKIVSEFSPRNVYNSDETGFAWTQLFVQKAKLQIAVLLRRNVWQPYAVEVCLVTRKPFGEW